MLSDGRSFYDVLEVSERASERVIANAYKTLIRQNHPDIKGPEGEAETANINLAFQTLKDPKSREEYNRDLHGSHRQEARAETPPSRSQSQQQKSNDGPGLKVNNDYKRTQPRTSQTASPDLILKAEIEAVRRAKSDIAVIAKRQLIFIHFIAVLAGSGMFLLAALLSAAMRQPVHPFLVLAVALCALVTLYFRKRELTIVFAVALALTGFWLAASIYFNVARDMRLSMFPPMIAVVGSLLLLVALFAIQRKRKNQIIYRRAKEWERLISVADSVQGVYQIMRSSFSSDAQSTTALLRKYGSEESEATVMLWGIHKAGEWCAVSSSKEVVRYAHQASPKCHKVIREQIPYDHVASLSKKVFGTII